MIWRALCRFVLLFTLTFGGGVTDPSCTSCCVTSSCNGHTLSGTLTATITNILDCASLSGISFDLTFMASVPLFNVPGWYGTTTVSGTDICIWMTCNNDGTVTIDFGCGTACSDGAGVQTGVFTPTSYSPLSVTTGTQSWGSNPSCPCGSFLAQISITITG